MEVQTERMAICKMDSAISATAALFMFVQLYTAQF